MLYILNQQISMLLFYQMYIGQFFSICLTKYLIHENSLIFANFQKYAKFLARKNIDYGCILNICYHTDYRKYVIGGGL